MNTRSLQNCLPGWLLAAGVCLLGGVLALDKAPADSGRSPEARTGRSLVAPAPDKPALKARGLFDNPIEFFSGALVPALSHSERARVQTTSRGFYLRADLQSNMEREIDPSEEGIYLNVAVRDAGEFLLFRDAVTTEGVISTRTVEIPALTAESQALRIVLKYGKGAPLKTVAAIGASIASVVKASGHGTTDELDARLQLQKKEHQKPKAGPEGRSR